MEYVLGVLMLLLSALIVFAVMSQSSQDKSLSGTITGSADTFYGKNKGKDKDKMFAKITAIAGIVFSLVAVVMYIFVINN